MEIFKREDAIKRLLFSLDIPRSPFFFDHEQGIGPYEPDFFQKSDLRRRESEELAEKALQGMMDEELWELCETPRCLDSFALEHLLFDPPPWYAGGFGVCVYKPDYAYWAKMDYWTVEEATCLSLGFKPEKIPQNQSGLPSPYAPLNFFRERLSLIQRATVFEKSENNSVSPSAFVGWAKSKSLEVPPELIETASADKASGRPKMLNSVDSRQYDSALKVILGLLAYHDAYRGGAITSGVKKDVTAGLSELGLSLDPKTLAKSLAEAIGSRSRFVEDQQKRDAKDV